MFSKTKRVSRIFLLTLFVLFPLNGGRWFRGDIVYYSINTFYFVTDTTAHFIENFPWETEVIGGHSVRAGYGTNAYGIVIGSFIALYANATNSCRQYGKRLPDVIIKSTLFDYITNNEVCFT